MKDNVDVVVYNKRYVIYKSYSDKNCINFKCDKRQVYYDQNCHIHQWNSVSRLIGCPFVLHVYCF